MRVLAGRSSALGLHSRKATKMRSLLYRNVLQHHSMQVSLRRRSTPMPIMPYHTALLALYAACAPRCRVGAFHLITTSSEIAQQFSWL